MSTLHESNLVGSFMYLWGYRDARAGKTEPPGLLVQAQNTLDHIVGDLFGATGATDFGHRRCFIIEFKRDLNGFSKEVRGSKAKAHRTALYQHLRNDSSCRKLAKFGHFGAYADGNDLVLVEYANAVGPDLETLKRESPPHRYDLDYPSPAFKFDLLYKELNETLVEPLHPHSKDPKNSLFYTEGDPHLYRKGLGLSVPSMQAYLRCMVQFCLKEGVQATEQSVKSAAHELIFGVSGKKSTLLAMGSFEGLLKACARYKMTVSPPASNFLP